MGDIKISDEQIRKILKTYKNGKTVPENEFSLVEEYSSMGVIRVGFSFSKKETQARLTERGKKILGLEDKQFNQRFKLQ